MREMRTAVVIGICLALIIPVVATTGKASLPAPTSSTTQAKESNSSSSSLLEYIKGLFESHKSDIARVGVVITVIGAAITLVSVITMVFLSGVSAVGAVGGITIPIAVVSIIFLIGALIIAVIGGIIFTIGYGLAKISGTEISDGLGNIFGVFTGIMDIGSGLEDIFKIWSSWARW